VRILVTGSKGFVGTETCKQLIDNGDEIVDYDLMDGWDIRDYDSLANMAMDNDVDRILHLAAIARFDECDNNPTLAFETNVTGTRNVVRVAHELHIPMVHASTGSVYMPITQEPPITEDFQIRGNSVYGCTKCTGEMYVAKHNPHIILRYAHLYGAEKRNHGLIGNFLDRIQRGLKPVIYGGGQSSDFCYIKDVAWANVLALHAPWDVWNNVYNIGSGEELTTEKAAEILTRVMNYKGDVEHIEYRGVDPNRFVYDVSKAEELLEFKACYKFEKGVRNMMKEDRLC